MPPSPPRRIPGGLTWVLVSAAAVEFWVGGFRPPVPARERLSVRLCACVAFSRGKIRRQQKIRNGSKG
jgi:hypothetical protein